MGGKEREESQRCDCKRSVREEEEGKKRGRSVKKYLIEKEDEEER